MDRGTHDRGWLRSQYHQTQTRRVRQHIKFAEYWYSANGLFTSILDNCSAIAAQSGLSFSPQEAFRWLSHGGIDDVPGQFAIGGLGLSAIKSVQKRFSNTDSNAVGYLIDGMNTFELDMTEARMETMALATKGTVQSVTVLVRDNARLPVTGVYGLVYEVLQRCRFIDQIVQGLKQLIVQSFVDNTSRAAAFDNSLLCLESMVAQGWVRCSHTPGRTSLSLQTPAEGSIVYTEKLGPAGRASAQADRGPRPR
jgi:hypothetical protein